jgi:hypothetical protein
MNARAAKDDLPQHLREIALMGREQCLRAWKRVFNSDPPRYLSVLFMQRVLAHDLQCRKLGGYPAATKRVLKAALTGGEVTAAARVVADNATLVRVWNGRVYRVEASADGYALDGKTFASLSAVARHITGARWSGPRFFGLTRKQSS